MNIAVLASHHGTNLQAIIDACEQHTLHARVCMVMSNNSASGAAERARRHDIPFYHLSGVTHPNPDELDAAMRDRLEAEKADLVFFRFKPSSMLVHSILCTPEFAWS